MMQALNLSSGHDHVRVERSALDLDRDDLARIVTPLTGVTMRAVEKHAPSVAMPVLRTFTVPADLHEQLWEMVLPPLAAGDAIDTQPGQDALAALSFLLATVSTGFDGALAIVAEIANGEFGPVPPARPVQARDSAGDATSYRAAAWINLDDEAQSATLSLLAGGLPGPIATLSIPAHHGVCWDQGTVVLDAISVVAPEPRARLLVLVTHRA
jgi:hypothetical protein